jgi:hypothetical protein
LNTNDATDDMTDVIYVNSYSAGLVGPLYSFDITKSDFGVSTALRPGESTVAARGTLFYRRWIVSNLGKDRAVMRPKRSKLHRWLRGDGAREIIVT